MTTITLRGICKSFGVTRALADIDLEIAVGKRLVLVGGSGAGKTTFLRILAGLERPDAGLIHFGEKDLTALPAHQRGIAMLSQDYAVYPHLTIERNLSAALEPLRLATSEIRDRIESAIVSFGLSELRSRRPAQLSGGQLQRVALAKALVRRPQMLMLDEPLSQLDVGLREQGRELILSLTEQYGTTLVMVTHDPMDAMRLADQIAVLERGRLIQFGSPQSVYLRPNSLTCAELLSPLGINRLELPSFRDCTHQLVFRPESVRLMITTENPEQPDDIHFEGQVQQLQFLGFATLALIATKTTSGAQLIKALVQTTVPDVGETVQMRIPKSELLLIPAEGS